MKVEGELITKLNHCYVGEDDEKDGKNACVRSGK